MSKSEGLTMNKKLKKSKMSMMLMALVFAASATMTMASDITGVTGVDGVFNISPSSHIGNVGFREYQNFQLSRGDKANLRFSGINKFVNMVDNQININGLVKTVDSANRFTPGHAVFMSPKGMVVGSDGVLNVGSLSVYTPTASGMKMLKDGVAAGNLRVQDGKYKGVDLMEAMGWHGNAPITINGKVAATNDVTMVANTLEIGNNAAVVAGANVTDSSLFNELVNTRTNNNANVEIRTYNRPSGQMIIKGNVRNMGKGDMVFTNRAAHGINLSGNVYNANGQTYFVNSNGEFAFSGNVEGNGDSVHFTNAETANQLNMSGGRVVGNAGIRIWNKSRDGLTLDADLVNKGKGLAITNEAGVLGIDGNITVTDSDMNITNTGSQLALNNINATNSNIVISNNGNLGMQLNGTIKNNKSTAITNYNGAMKVNGTVQSTAGKLNLTNKGNGGLTLARNSQILGAGEEVLVQNVGAGGFNAQGTVQSSAKTYLQNTNGNMTIDGNLSESNKLLYVGNMAGNGKLTLNGDISANSSVQMYNAGKGGMELNGTILNSGSTAVTNAAGAMLVNGTVHNTAGKMNLTNKGEGGLMLAEGSHILSEGEQVLVQNTGAGGFTSRGEITSSAKTYLQNTNGDMKVESGVTNRNNLLYVGNVGNGGLTVNGKLTNQNGKIRVYNEGRKGMMVNADIENKNAGTALTNRMGNLALNANIANQKGNINLTNVGNGSLTIASGKTVSTTDGEIAVQNSGSNGMNINGIIDTKKGNAIVYNKSGNLNLASTGKVMSESGNVYVSNAGNALNTQKGSEIIAKGSMVKLSMLNTGKGGMNLNGTTRSHSGTTRITNRAGNLNLNGLVENSGGRVYLNNSGNGALKVTNNGGISNVGRDRTYLTNKGAGGMQVDGTVAGGGHIIATNRAGGMNITSKVTSTKSNVVLTNTGKKDMNITGTVRGKKVTAKSVGNDIVLGNKETNQISINGLKKVFITTENGSIKNAGVDTHVIKSGGNLYMAAKNGSIGEDVNTSGVGANSRDLTKSINVVVDGRVKAFTTDKKNNSVINIATKGHDLNVDRIKADGKAILLTDKYTDENGEVHTGSILNDATELKHYANVKGTSVHMLSSGSIGTDKKPLHFRQTDASQQSNVVAVKNINLHARGRKDGEAVNFGVIKSKEGSIKADLIKDATIDKAIAAKKINITSRRNGNLKINKSSHNTDIIKDYFD